MTARRQRRPRWHARAIAIGMALLGACSKRDRETDARVVASASASSSPSAAKPASSGAPTGSRPVWFAGTWTGTYRAAPHRIDLGTDRGGIPEWKVDDGKAYVGPGAIEIACANDGTVSGSLHGSLGEQELHGESDDQALSARFVPRGAGPMAISGTLTVSRTGSDVTGELSASTADGHIARTASVTLTRAER